MIPKSLYPRFFAAHRRACLALGLNTPDEQSEYYRRVVLDEARVMSVKRIENMRDFERCLARFAADSGDYQAASNYDIDSQKRRAFVVKVMCLQILQLERIPPALARGYFEGVLERSRLGASFHASGETFYLDIPALNLQKVLQILDTHLRRLKRRLDAQCRPTFNWNEKFEYGVNGKPFAVPAEKYFYANAPFIISATTK